MKKTILLILTLLFTLPIFSQEDSKEKGRFFKALYKDFIKYGTVYAAGDLRSPYE